LGADNKNTAVPRRGLAVGLRIDSSGNADLQVLRRADLRPGDQRKNGQAEHESGQPIGATARNDVENCYAGPNRGAQLLRETERHSGRVRQFVSTTNIASADARGGTLYFAQRVVGSAEFWRILNRDDQYC